MKAKANPGLCRNGPPLGQGNRASLLVGFPADEVALRIEMVVDLAVDGCKFLGIVTETSKLNNVGDDKHFLYPPSFPARDHLARRLVVPSLLLKLSRP